MVSEQNVHEYYMLNHTIRLNIFKKTIIIINKLFIQVGHFSYKKLLLIWVLHKTNN